MSKVKSKKRKWFLIPVVILIVLVAAGIIRYNEIQQRSKTNPDPTFSQPKRPETMVAWGEVTYDKIYDIIIDFPTFVTDVKVKEGDRVSLGQELAELDMSEYHATIDKLQEQIASGKAALENTHQDTTALLADIAQLKEDIETKTREYAQETNADLIILQTTLESAKTELDIAKRDVQDHQTLYAAGSIPKSVLDQYTDILTRRENAFVDVENNIEKTKRALKTELDQLNLALQSKQTQLNQIERSNAANTAMQKSSINVSQIDLKMMKNKSTKEYLNNNHIVSHIENGIVKNIGVMNGTAVGTQHTPTRVLQLIDMDSIVVSAEVDEEFIKKVNLGMTVQIVPPQDNSLSIPGEVIHISNLAVEKDGKRIVKVQVKPQDPQWELKPGYSADVYFPVK
ncbi:MAG: HlyD family efflux transporter periplasmic adaptor subunit [Clostridiaceae bacterium]|nr:HlyD family efflux transporter periplasmic adaptor subunit [Clostridiaceae bacterium]